MIETRLVKGQKVHTLSATDKTLVYITYDKNTNIIYNKNKLKKGTFVITALDILVVDNHVINHKNYMNLINQGYIFNN